jgi:ribosomal protein S16
VSACHPRVDAHPGPPPQYLGWYNPLKKETQLDAPAIKKWLDVGAQPTVSVENLLKKALIVPAGEKKVYNQMSTKDATAAKNARAAAVKKALDAAKAKAKARADAAAKAAKDAKAAAAAAEKAGAAEAV